MGITKNHQGESTLQAMAARAFPGQTVLSIRELTEGMCNAAYLLTLSDGRDVVVKIAAPGSAGLLRNEEGLMRAEVAALTLVRTLGDVPVPRVYAHDDTRTLCSGEYFFMEALPGQSLYSQRDSIPPETRAALHREIGRIERRVASLTAPQFGLLGSERRYATLYDLFRAMMENVLLDAEEKQVDLLRPAQRYLDALRRDEGCFAEVAVPRLVHWDLWEGNVFVKDGQISGIIDWERALWGDPLMDDRFRRHTRTADFLAGYGQTRDGRTAFTPAETRRVLWYDVFLYLTMMTEGSFRGYPDDSQYRWTMPLMQASWGELNE